MVMAINLQRMLGGPTRANNTAAPILENVLGKYLNGTAQMPVPQEEMAAPQQQESPQINFDALSKVKDSDMRKMVLNWLMGLAMQREDIRARQQIPLDPTQQIASRKLAMIDKLQTEVDAGTATKEKRALLEKMLAGGPMVQIGMGTPASPGERTSIRDSRASIDSLLNLKQLYSDKYVGPVVGRISGTAGLVGATSLQQENFMAANRAFQNAVIKQITGAQLSESEAKRIMKQIPLITDPPTRYQAKWTQTMKNVQDIYNRQLEVIGQSGLRVPGVETETEPSSLGGRLSTLSDDDLLRILGGEE